MQRDIFKPTLLSLVIAESLLTACSPSPSNSRDTSPATPVIAQPTPVIAAPTMMMEAAAMSKMARYSPIMPIPMPRQQDNSEKYQHLAANPIHQLPLMLLPPLVSIPTRAATPMCAVF